MGTWPLFSNFFLFLFHGSQFPPDYLFSLTPPSSFFTISEIVLKFTVSMDPNHTQKSNFLIFFLQPV